MWVVAVRWRSSSHWTPRWWGRPRLRRFPPPAGSSWWCGRCRWAARGPSAWRWSPCSCRCWSWVADRRHFKHWQLLLHHREKEIWLLRIFDMKLHQVWIQKVSYLFDHSLIFFCVSDDTVQHHAAHYRPLWISAISAIISVKCCSQYSEYL